MTEQGMQRRVTGLERLRPHHDLSPLSDAEIEAAFNDVQQRLLEGYASSLDRFSTPERADQAEAALRKIVARGEAAARIIVGRVAPRATTSKE